MKNFVMGGCSPVDMFEIIAATIADSNIHKGPDTAKVSKSSFRCHNLRKASATISSAWPSLSTSCLAK